MSAIQTIRTTVNSLDEIAGLIATPPTDRPIAGAIGNTGRRVCDAYGNVKLAGSLLFGPTNSVINLVCKPYFDQEGYDPPVPEAPPFEGGQCPTNYLVTYFLPIGQITKFQQTLLGPIGEVVIQRINSQFVTVCFPTGNGLVCSATAVSLFPSQEAEAQTTVARTDGQPDNCGNLPSDLVPGPNPPPDPGPFPPGQEPGVDPTGQPFFYVPDIEIPGLDPIPLDDDPLGDGPQKPAPPAGGDGMPGDPDAIGDEAGEVTGGEDGENIDFGEPPDGRIWVGCIVETLTGSGIGNIPGTGPLSTVWPSVRANVALRYPSRYGTSQRINSKFHEVFRPNTSLVVEGCFLQVQPGSTSKVFPISALKCPDNPCGDE